MTSPRLTLLSAAALFAFAGLNGYAQSVISAQSGLIHYVEGRVLLGDRAVDSKFGEFPQMKENQVLRTEEGRAEVLLNPGVFLRVAENSSLRMLSTRLTDSRAEFLSGTILIEAADLQKENAVTIFYGDATVQLLKDGLYRFESDPPQLRVYDGKAMVTASDQQVEVKKGKLIGFDGSMVVQKFDTDQTDAFDRWSGRRASYLAMANVYAAKSISDSGMAWRSSAWRWNPYFGMFTFIPAGGLYMSPYGYRFWSPERVYVLYQPPRPTRTYSDFGGYGARVGSSSVPRTSAGTSGTIAVRTSSPPAAGGGSSARSAPIPRDSGRAGGRDR
jgi:hypothetical protein